MLDVLHRVSKALFYCYVFQSIFSAFAAYCHQFSALPKFAWLCIFCLYFSRLVSNCGPQSVGVMDRSRWKIKRWIEQDNQKWARERERKTEWIAINQTFQTRKPLTDIHCHWQKHANGEHINGLREKSWVFDRRSRFSYFIRNELFISM